MKKILISLAVIAVVGIAVAGATGAFYNDTETSAGNIFTAGSIDLKVDHLKQTYNGVDCKTCGVTIQSDTTNEVVATNGGSDPTNLPHNAVAVSNPHPAWTVTADIPGATWIWATNPTLDADAVKTVTYTFRKHFTWMGPISGATLSLGVGSDNGFEVKLNGNLVGADSSEFNYKSPAHTYSSFGSYIVQGDNVLEITVTNMGLGEGSNGASNPAGLLYKLTINGNCGDDYFKQQCRLWQEKDLGPGDTFFNFGDVKPADFGTNVISLHVSSNDAYACLLVGDKNDQENNIYDPETEAGDLPDKGNTPGYGELSNYLNVFTWADDNDGVYEPGSGEIPLGSGPLSSLTSIMSMDSGNQQFLVSTTTKYIGLAWCAGTLTVDGNGVFKCDGGGMKNDAQSDSFSATLTAYAEQTRNNGEFKCANVQLPPRVTTGI